MYRPKENHLQPNPPHSPVHAHTGHWHCHACRALLGIARGTHLHVKYKDAEIWIVGRCRCICRRCGKANESVVGRAPGKEDR